jgi:hypothetical protein
VESWDKANYKETELLWADAIDTIGTKFIGTDSLRVFILRKNYTVVGRDKWYIQDSLDFDLKNPGERVEWGAHR